ncbi:MAG: thioesterase domain-containing protein [Nocardioidaceae bacterium]|nr:thioesterase domain-containing protein [Nocardioidaceae bacterium]
MTDLQAATVEVHRLIPIIAAMDLEVIELERTAVAARLPTAPNRNHFGVTYAGSLFTVAEVLGGLFPRTSLTTDGGVPLVKRLEIDFLLPATSDVVARATLTEDEIARILAEYADRGKSNFELVTEVSDAGGAVVARTRGDYQLRRL